MWLTNEQVVEFFVDKNYDIRISHDARWIDQKCTPDVLTIIADCILAYVCENPQLDFTSMDIWHNKYTVDNVLNIFKKPNPDEDVARNEYDKFFQQPMKLLSYAGVLKETKRGTRNFYSVSNKEMLEFISIREKNSLDFLAIYIEKVMKDSGLFYLFDNFFSLQNKDSYHNLKRGFTQFTIANTPINKETECWRIFIKVINPLAYKRNALGTERGNISKHIITYDMLMYNRDNFRDLYKDKPKNVTRKEYDKTHKVKENKAYFAYLSTKAKRSVKEYNSMYNNDLSEVYDENSRNEIASQIHHIFPESEFPKISYYYENLIALHPTQHYNYAHPNGNTSLIDKPFQHICLISKANTIENDYKCKRGFYDFNKFITVLSTGLNSDNFEEVPLLDFPSLVKEINLAYQEL